MAALLSLQHLRERIAQSAFNSWLGLEPASLTENALECRMVVRAEMSGSHETGFVHGGLLATLIDATSSYLVIAKTGRPVATVNLRTDFHRPVKAGKLIARAEVIKIGRTLSTIDVRVSDEQGHLVASGRVLLSVRAENRSV